MIVSFSRKALLALLLTDLMLPVSAEAYNITIAPERVQNEWNALLELPRLSYDRLNFSPSSETEQAPASNGFSNFDDSDEDKAAPDDTSEDPPRPANVQHKIIVTQVIIKGPANKRLKKQLLAYSRPLISHSGKHAVDINTFERAILLMNDLPGVFVRPDFKPLPHFPDCYLLVLNVVRRKGTPVPDLLSTTRLFLPNNQSDLLVTPPQQRNYFLRLGYDNRNTYLLKEQRYTLDLNFNGLLGPSTRTGYRMAVDSRTQKLVALEVRHTFGLSCSGGDRVNISFRQNRIHGRGFLLSDLPVKGNMDQFRLVYVYPWLRRARQNFYLDAGIQLLNSHMYAYPTSDAVRLYQDKLRVAQVGFRYHNMDPYLGMNTLAFHLWQGINGLGASTHHAQSLSRPGSTVNYTKLVGAVSRFQSLGTHFGLLLAAQGQYSFNALPFSALFGFGGAEFGRGYEPSLFAGDSGFKGKAELQLNSEYNWRLLNQVQWFCYYDLGKIWLRRLESNPAGLSRNISGNSAGLGMRVRFTPYLMGDLEMARTLTRDNIGRNPNKVTFYFNIAALL